MQRRTQGIVLRTQVYGESSLILSAYTRHFGRKDFIAKGVRTTRGKAKHSLYQVLNQLDIVFYDKATRELQTLTESHFAAYYQQLGTHPVKNLYGLLTAEIFRSAVPDTTPNEDLYNAFAEHLNWLDTAPGGLYAGTLHFLLHLTRHLGCWPVSRVQAGQPAAFSVEEGEFHRAGAPDALASHLLQLYHTPSKAQLPTIPKAERKALLQLLLRYYAYHLDYFRPPKSLAVFEALFA